METNQEGALLAAVIAAAGRPEVRQAVASIYAELTDAIEIRRPVCKTSGRCCRFEEYGHRLYVSTMELGKLVSDWRHADRLATAQKHLATSLPVLRESPVGKPGCPFQVDGLCGIHGIRPFGCRIFFCDESSTAWQHDMYEGLHGKLRKLHEQLQVPYFYVEWRYALNTVISLTTPPG